MGISSETSRLVAVLSRSLPFRAVNRPESALQLCLGVIGLLGTVAVIATLHRRGTLRDDDKTPRSPDERVKPRKRDHAEDKSANLPIEHITTPPPAYQSEYIDSASTAMIDEMADSVEYIEEEVAQSPSAGSRFRRRMKKTFKLGRKNSAQS